MFGLNFTPLEHHRLLSVMQTEINYECIMLPSAGREVPVLTGFTVPVVTLSNIDERRSVFLYLGPIVKRYYASMAWMRSGSDSP